MDIKLEKTKLDSEFSLLTMISHERLEALAGEYERLKAIMMKDVVDIATKLDAIYDQLRNR
jgi:hypothetical protein